MIINIRGTSGSGKSHLIRAIMALYARPTKIFDRSIPEGKTKPRKQPIGYICGGDKGRMLAVVGHYETPCGGCDTIPNMERIFELVRLAHSEGSHVLFEGLLISADIKRTLALHDDGLPLKVIALETELEACLAGVNDRRMKRMGNKYTPVPSKNTESKFKGVKSSMRKLQANGVDARWCDRAGAFELVQSWLEQVYE